MSNSLKLKQFKVYSVVMLCLKFPVLGDNGRGLVRSLVGTEDTSLSEDIFPCK